MGKLSHNHRVLYFWFNSEPVWDYLRSLTCQTIKRVLTFTAKLRKTMSTTTKRKKQNTEEKERSGKKILQI